MTKLNVESATTNLDDKDLELVSGGRTLFEDLHRLWFAATCGGTLTVKGDQLQCRG